MADFFSYVQKESSYEKPPEDSFFSPTFFLFWVKIIFMTRKTEGNFHEFHTHDDKEEGEVTIQRNPNKNKNDNKDGEYVDYEEVD